MSRYKDYVKIGTRQVYVDKSAPENCVLPASVYPNDGKEYIIGSDGEWIDVATIESSTEDKKTTKSVEIRSTRDELADRVSREINRLEDIGVDASNWREYRQKLRDIPEQDGFPFDIDWGELPADFTGK